MFLDLDARTPDKSKPMRERTLHADVSPKRLRRRSSHSGGVANQHPESMATSDSGNVSDPKPTESPSKHGVDGNRVAGGWTSTGPVKAKRPVPVPPPRQARSIHKNSASVEATAANGDFYFDTNSLDKC